MKIFNIPIRLDFSWLFILILVIWSLSSFVFPSYCRDYPVSQSTFWIMGVLGGLGIFGSILFHELSHALVAKKHGLSINRITLFIFGGVAEIADEPPSSKSEFRMAAAGPIFSYLVAAFFFFVEYISKKYDFPISERAVANYLAWGNFVLASFNLVPAFPLDGGRILRAYLWSKKKSLVEATRSASKIGSGFGVALMAMGVITFLFQNFIGGMWYFLLGMFLREAAQASYKQVVLKKSFEGEPVSRFMETNPVAIPSDLSLRDTMDNFFVKYQYRLFPVIRAGQLVGCFRARELKKVPKSNWDVRRVEEYMEPISEKNSVSSKMDAKQALTQMSQQGEDRLLVVEDGTLVGVLVLKDMLNYFALVFEFQEPERAAA